MNQMIKTLRDYFGAVERLDPDGKAYKGLCAILDKADDKALKAVHAANIKFVSVLAFNRMIRRGIHEAR